MILLGWGVAPPRARRRGIAVRPPSPVLAYSVGRAQPDSELTQQEEAAQLLRADLAHHEPAAGDLQGLTNWAALTHKLQGWLLRWGQFVTRLRDDWWWGDDDELAFSALKAEYNLIRNEVIEFTTVKPKAPPVVVNPPALEESEKETPPWQVALERLTVLGVVGVGGYLAIRLLPVVLAARAARGGA